MIDGKLLDGAIARGLEAVWRTQRDDGSIDGSNHGGPLYSGIALVSRAQVEDIDHIDRERVVPWMKSQQRDDGSYATSPCAPTGSIDATVCVYAGLKAAGVPESDPAQRHALRYIEGHGGFLAANPMYFPTLAIAGLVRPSDLPTPHLFFKLIPFADELMARLLNQWVGMSANITPALLRAVKDGGRAGAFQPIRWLEEERVLAFLKEVQNPSGSLSGVLLYTAQLVSTYAALDEPADSPHLVAARSALTAFRLETPEGAEYMPFTAEVWNTALAIRATVRAQKHSGGDALWRAIQWLLDRQTTEDAPRAWQNPAPGAPRSGGWPFEAPNIRNPDCDTTGAALDALGTVLTYPDGLSPAQRRAVSAAVDKGVAWTLGMQNDDGGWPSMTRDNGQKPKGPFFEKPFAPPMTLTGMFKTMLKPPLELQDPSTAAMTGRIMSGLRACGVGPDTRAQQRAADFLEAQVWNNRFWGRWEVNYIAGTSFGLVGADAAEAVRPFRMHAADWLASQQNADGGFGEGTETYSNWQATGPWPSRADLTGKALTGLLSAPGVSPTVLEKAARWLIDAQHDDGFYRTDDGEYVILPPDLFYTNPACNQIDAVEGLVVYRNALAKHSRWTDSHLDAMRQVGDPVADEVIRALFEAGDIGSVNALFAQLVRDDEPVPSNLPSVVANYFESTETLPDFADPGLLAAGEGVFRDHGLSVACALFCSSLPHAYCAHRGANVLMETGRMENDFTRRMIETAQFVMDVLAPGGLEPQGRGIRTVQKVRLMHAAIRHMVTTQREWPAGRLGVPINQEDLAGTLLTFSVVVLRALETMGQDLSERERQGYFHTWRCIGHMLGIHRDMLPNDIDDAYEQFAMIAERQFAPSEQGKALTHALIEAMESYVPGCLFDGSAAVYVRHLIGNELADMLDVPQPDWTNVLYEVGTALGAELDDEAEHHVVLRDAWALFTHTMMVGISDVFRRGKQVTFRIPDELRVAWNIPAPDQRANRAV